MFCGDRHLGDMAFSKIVFKSDWRSIGPNRASHDLERGAATAVALSSACGRRLQSSAGTTRIGGYGNRPRPRFSARSRQDRRTCIGGPAPRAAVSTAQRRQPGTKPKIKVPPVGAAARKQSRDFVGTGQILLDRQLANAGRRSSTKTQANILAANRLLKTTGEAFGLLREIQSVV